MLLAKGRVCKVGRKPEAQIPIVIINLGLIEAEDAHGVVLQIVGKHVEQELVQPPEEEEERRVYGISALSVAADVARRRIEPLLGNVSTVELNGEICFIALDDASDKLCSMEFDCARTLVYTLRVKKDSLQFEVELHVEGAILHFSICRSLSPFINSLNIIYAARL